MRPHVEKKIGKLLKIGLVIAIFVRLTKIQKRIKKITRRTTTSERNKFLQVIASFRYKDSDSK